MKERQGQIIIGGNVVLNVFFYVVALVASAAIGYLLGRYAAANPVDLMQVYVELFSTI